MIKMKIKRIIYYTCLLIFMCSCMINKQIITDYHEKMELLKQFPELYNLYKEGKIRIEQLYTYENNEGEEQIRVLYQHIPY